MSICSNSLKPARSSRAESMAQEPSYHNSAWVTVAMCNFAFNSVLSMGLASVFKGEGDIVDKPGGTGVDRPQYRDLPVIKSRGGQGPAVTHSKIVDLETRSLYPLPAFPFQSGEIMTPFTDALRHPLQGVVQHIDPGSFGGANIAISRTHCQTIRLPMNGRRGNRHRDAQILRHPPNHCELLKILDAEHRLVGLNDVEQLGDHRGDPLEMS